MNPAEATSLFHLRCVWQDRYSIGLTDGVWYANRLRDPTNVLTADTAEDLSGLLQSDYRGETSGEALPPSPRVSAGFSQREQVGDAGD